RRRPPTSPPFPSTTLFRSAGCEAGLLGGAARRDAHDHQIAVQRFGGDAEPRMRRSGPLAVLEHLAEDRLDQVHRHEQVARNARLDRKSTRLNSSHVKISYA